MSAGLDVEATLVELVEIVAGHDETLARLGGSSHVGGVVEAGDVVPLDDAFVDWLVTHYGLDDVFIDGWRRVPAFVSEVVGLQIAYAAAEGAPGIDAVYWHDALARVLPRLVRWCHDATTGSGPDALVGWVEWLRDTYLLTAKIAANWAEIPAVVAELRALHRAHCAAFAPGAGGFEEVYWHDALARVLPRIDDWQKEARKARS